VNDLNNIIKVQNKYICALQDARAQTTEKVNELIALLPEAQTQTSEIKIHFEGNSEADSAAVVMFRQLEAAKKLVAKHQPQGALYKELSELLK